jgi:hypothetical protein
MIVEFPGEWWIGWLLHPAFFHIEVWFLIALSDGVLAFHYTAL